MILDFRSADARAMADEFGILDYWMEKGGLKEKWGKFWVPDNKVSGISATLRGAKYGKMEKFENFVNFCNFYVCSFGGILLNCSFYIKKLIEIPYSCAYRIG